MTTAFLFFTISGFCSLLYQIVWTRLAFSHFGIIHPVLAVVVSTFMFGQALGAWAAGRWTAQGPRVDPRWDLRRYATCEFFIGLGAFAVPQAFRLSEQFLLHFQGTHSLAYLASSALILILSLLPWCIAMGATIPFMMSFLKQQYATEENSFSWLYLGNVLGAVLGTLLTALLLIELFDFEKTLWIAGSLNFMIALSAWWLPNTMKATPAQTLHTVIPEAQERKSSGSRMPLTLLFITGFISLSNEVIWTRLFTVVLKTTIYAFASLLGTYLLAVLLGTWLYRYHVRRGRPWPVYTLVAGLALSNLLPLLMNDPRLNPAIFQTLSSILLFCGLCGYLTPYLIDLYAKGDAQKTGQAYAINAIGCILGPLVASYLFLPFLGSRMAIGLSCVPFLVCYWIESNGVSFTKRFVIGGLVAVTSLIGSLAVISYEEPYRALDPQAIVRRDEVATVISMGQGMEKRLFVNGVGITFLTPITKDMAHLPLCFLKKPPTSALVICFGMGTTYRSLLTWGIRVVGAELVPSVRDAFGYYHADAAQVLQNPLGRVEIDDGRRYLKRTTEQFDVITLDPPPPLEAAGSSLLYSKEFYDIAKKRLKPGGILQQWFPGGEIQTFRAILKTLQQSFPYGYIFMTPWGTGCHFIVSMEPLKVPTPQEMYARMPIAARADLVEWDKDKDARVHLTRISQKLVSPAQLRFEPGEYMTDDHAFNEYFLIRRFGPKRWFSSNTPAN